MNKLHQLMEEIRHLEEELVEEIQKKQDELLYKIKGTRVTFEEHVKESHKAIATRLTTYIMGAPLLTIVTAPVIWLCLFPAILMDVIVSFYQAVCFPVYNIPKVSRRDYIVIDRQALAYLNIIEKINCMYCGYFIGVISYTQEVAARTEQYWCPIKHARKLKYMHSRYHKFLEFGDADVYHQGLDSVRQELSQIKD